jgi:hypothetical protein
LYSDDRDERWEMSEQRIRLTFCATLKVLNHGRQICIASIGKMKKLSLGGGKKKMQSQH